jgi:multidrug efflux pump subunit AcrA (membrane-fusion protein)
VRKKILFCLVGLVLVLTSGCGAGKEAGALPEIAKPVTVKAVSRGEVNLVHTVSGRVGPASEVQVVPKMGGRVAEVAVNVGDAVRPGQVLVRLDAADLAVQVRQAEAAVAVATANLNNLLAGTRPEQLAQAEAALEAARAGLENARANQGNTLANLERMRYLYQQGAISRQQLEGSETQERVAAGGLIQAGAQFRQAEEALRMAKAGPTAEVLNVARAQLKQAEAGLLLARNHLANSVITAPVAGRVNARHVEEGEMAGPAMPVVTLLRQGPEVVEFEVTEAHVNYLSPGQELPVRIRALTENTLLGRVKTVSLAADLRTRAFQARVEIVPGQVAVRPGMTAAIDIPIASRTGVIAVPLASVLERGGQNIAFVVKDNRAEVRELTLGAADHQTVEVTAGLNEGELLVVAGQHLLSDGDLVAVKEGGLSP